MFHRIRKCAIMKVRSEIYLQFPIINQCLLMGLIRVVTGNKCESLFGVL